MNTSARLLLGMVAGTMLAAGVCADESAPFRMIPIPPEEHGYGNFESMVIATPSELEAFMQAGAVEQDLAWNNRADFEDALKRAALDFDRESLVLLRHTEGSGSVRVNLLKPHVVDRRLVFQIERAEPEIGTTVMAYYCFALAVAKGAVDSVALEATGRTPVVLTLPGDAALHSPTEGENIMSDSSPREIAMMWAAAYNRHDPDAAAALYDEQVTNVQMPYGKPVQGREAMRATYVNVFRAFPDIQVEIENIVQDGPWVAVEWRFTGTMRGEFAGQPPTHAPFTLRGCELFRVENGRIQAQRGYWDKASMFAQLNLTMKP